MRVKIIAHKSAAAKARGSLYVFVLAVCALVMLSCAPSKKFLGSKRPDFANSACKIDSGYCSVNLGKDDWKVSGSYSLKRVGDGSYSLDGDVNLNLSGISPVMQKIEKLWITFAFLDGDLVVYETRVSLTGKSNTRIEFSKQFATEADIDATLFAWIEWRAKGLEVY